MINLFIGNLPSGTSEPELRGFFATFGQVARVLMVSDFATGLPRDFCFVDMDMPAGARMAERLKGATLRGNPLEVIEAVSPSGWKLGGA